MAESVKGLKKLLKDLNIPFEDIDKIVQANASEMAQTARRLAPIDTGKLRQSIRKRKTELFAAEVTAGARYAPYMEFGTGGFVEVPEPLQEVALQFKGKSSGRFPFIQTEAGPGRRISIRPQPFMYPALVLQRDIFINDIDKYLDKRFK